MRRKPRRIIRKRKTISATRGSSNVILKLGSSSSQAPSTLISYGPPGGGGSSSSSSSGGGGYTYGTPPVWQYSPPPILGGAPTVGGNGSGGGGGGRVPGGGGPSADPSVLQRMVKQELGELWDALKKTHTSSNAEVLSRFEELKQQVQAVGEASQTRATKVLKAVRKATTDLHQSVGNTREAVDALNYAVGASQAAAEQWRAGQEVAGQQTRDTMLAALQELRNGLASDTSANVGGQLAILEQAITSRERPDARVLQALGVVRDQVLTSTGQGIAENRAMFEALARYLTQSVNQVTGNQRTLAQGIGRTIEQGDATQEGLYALVQQAQSQASLNAEQFLQMRTGLNQVVAAGNTLAGLVQSLPERTFDHFYDQLMPRQDGRQPNVHRPGIIPNAPPAPHHGALEAQYGALVPAQPRPAPSATDAAVPTPPFPGQEAVQENNLVAVYAPRDLTRLPLPGEDEDMVT